MAKRKTSAALAWMLTAAMAINSGSVVWAAEDGMISVERIDAGETAEFSDSSEEISSLVNEAQTVVEVLMFATARQMVVEHLGPNETLLGVISIAILFGIRKYLMTDNDDMNSHKNKDAETH